MAMYDDRQWLLSHIQNSYATSDDSGLSEVVLQGNWPIDKLVDFPFLYPDDSITSGDPCEESEPHSLDVHSDQSYVGHRLRSNTEHLLENMKKEKNLQAKITRITWQSNTKPLTESEAEELFGAQPVPTVPQAAPGPSLLSQMLEQDDLAENPYLEYAKWDASTDVNVATKRRSIFVYNTPSSETPRYPVRVVVSPHARVLDVIGLTCFLHTRDNLQPPLTLPPSAYCLRIADEDGSVDWEFQPLLHSHPFEKFGFQVLAVAPAPEDDASQDPSVTVRVNISGGVFSLIECESRGITLREVLNRTIAKRREMARVVEAGVQYHLEDEPGRVLDLDRTLDDVGTTSLHAVRDNSKRAPNPEDVGTLRDHSPQASYTFPVTWVKKWAKFDSTVDVTYGGVLVTVTGGGSGGLLRPPHPVSYPSNKIVCCNVKNSSSNSSSAKKLPVGGGANKDKQVSDGGGGRASRKGDTEAGTKSSGTSEKSSRGEGGGRCEVLMTCMGEQRFKDYLFECDEAVGLELVEVVKRIKTEDNTSKKTREDDKPRRRYSLAGLKKKNRANYGQRGPPN